MTWYQGNNRTRSVLVGLRGVVEKAVGLGSWHWLVLTNGDEVKLQRNALSVIEVPREEEIYDCGDVSFSGSDLGSRNTPRRALDDMSFHPSKEQLVEAVERHFLSQDMVAGGVDTTSTTLEWAMAEMMHKPEIMKKAQEELDAVVGKDNILEDYHCVELHYLEAVVKKALRLHPPNVFLIPHSAIESCVVGGYTIPKNTAIFVNLWEIQRDPSLWNNPSEFNPERFLSSATAGDKWDYRGNDFRYFPFGSGRRICPGISLAEWSLKYVLGTLLHSFNWKLPVGAKIDLSDKFGQVLKIANPVVAIPTPRLSNPHLYSLLLKEESGNQ
ncbi:cytochrome P450 monooxygenase 76AD131-like isoform X2 [Tasmannia lanceolata]|uniref:cytochrome P450 monooxygenase 76AD131-like isoform X2 n=1 Tax=Tasmannia lanceolata TaxID=3420 RepID=UPI0040644DD3